MSSGGTIRVYIIVVLIHYVRYVYFSSIQRYSHTASVMDYGITAVITLRAAGR